MPEFIEFDCKNEEPGYFIRLAMTMSAISKKPVKINNIREEGLIKSDIYYIKLITQLTNGNVSSIKEGEKVIEYTPGNKVRTGALLNLKMPGVVSVFLPYLIMLYLTKDVKIRVNGPTNEENKITIDYIKEVFSKILAEINIKTKIDITKRGYHSNNGSIILTTKKTKFIDPMFLTHKGYLDRIVAIIHSYGHPEEINDYMIEGAKKRLKLDNVRINTIINSCIDNKDKFKGYGMDLIAQYENTIIGANYTSIKKQASQLGKESADRFISATKKDIPLDKHSANLIMPFLALANGQSNIKIPRKDTYVETVNEICSKLIDTKFEFEEEEDFVNVKIIPSGF